MNILITDKQLDTSDVCYRISFIRLYDLYSKCEIQNDFILDAELLIVTMSF